MLLACFWHEYYIYLKAFSAKWLQITLIYSFLKLLDGFRKIGLGWGLFLHIKLWIQRSCMLLKQIIKYKVVIFSIIFLHALNEHDVNVVMNVKCNVILALQLTQGFELYAVFGPLVTKPVAIAAINKLLRWIKKEEEHLFILSSVTFWLALDIRIWNILVFIYTCSSDLNLHVCVDWNAVIS